MNRIARKLTQSAFLSCILGFGVPELSEASVPRVDQFPGDPSVSTDLWKKEFFERKPEEDEENLTAEAMQKRSVLQNENDLLVGTAPRIQLARNSGLQVAGAELPTLSDWEHAATRAIGPKEINITTLEGPSAVTLVVAVVGFIVVCGAYLQK